MVMGMIWMVLVVTAVIAAALEGNLGALSPAVMEGASSAIRLALSLAGALCLWSALAKLMEKAGALRGLARVMRPVFRRLFPQASRDETAMGYLCANVSANLLGLGNAATPMGIAADAGACPHPDGYGRDVPPDRHEHRFHPAAADHGRCGAGLAGRGRTLRYSAGGVGQLGALGHGRAAGGAPLAEVLPCLICSFRF